MGQPEEAIIRVRVEVKLVRPDGSVATFEEVRQAIEEEIAAITHFDVDAAESEEGVEVWTVDEANYML